MLSHIVPVSLNGAGTWQDTATYSWTAQDGSTQTATISEQDSPTFSLSNQGTNGQYEDVGAGAYFNTFDTQNGVRPNITAVVSPYYDGQYSGYGYGSLSQLSGSASAQATFVAQIVADGNDKVGDPVLVDVYPSQSGVDVGYTNVGDTFSYTVNGSTPGYGSAYLAHIGDLITVTMSATAQYSGNANSATASDGSGEVDLLLSPPPPTLVVTAKYNDSTAANTFGNYLHGVSLNNPFTVSETNLDGQIASVEYDLDGGPFIAAQSSGTNQWTFTQNVGQLKLPAGTHQLEVIANDASGNELATYVGSVVVVDKLRFDLGVSVGGATVDDANLRFLSGVPAAVDFTGTIAGLPQYYENQLQVFVGASPMKLSFDANQNETSIFHFDYDTSKLKAGPKGAAAITQVKAAVDHLPLDTVFGDTPETLTAIAEPAWLKTGKPSFDSQTDAYQFADAKPAVAQLSAPELATGIEWLDGGLKKLTTSVTLTPDLTVLVPVDINSSPTAAAQSLTASALVLGFPVWQATYTSGDVNVGLALDPNTLEPNDLSVTLAHAVNLANETLLDKTFSIPLKTSFDPLVRLTASLALKLTGSLDVNGAGMELKWENNQLNWVAAGTFIDMEATVDGEGIAFGKAVIASGLLGTYAASVEVDATLDITGRAELGGPVAHPQLVSPQLTGTIEGSYYYGLTGVDKKTGKPIQEPDRTPDGTFGPNGPVTLFKL